MAAFIHHEHITRACALLAATDYSLREICRKTGYNFSKVFKKFTGVPPEAYRAGHRCQ
ncbi:MAG: helix-turn-helix domain-containing protein [Victivallales bacterium]|nr:helix-turn-helix domain-containing protein [Victivallales bacterium]